MIVIVLERIIKIFSGFIYFSLLTNAYGKDEFGWFSYNVMLYSALVFCFSAHSGGYIFQLFGNSEKLNASRALSWSVFSSSFWMLVTLIISLVLSLYLKIELVVLVAAFLGFTTVLDSISNALFFDRTVAKVRFVAVIVFLFLKVWLVFEGVSIRSVLVLWAVEIIFSDLFVLAFLIKYVKISGLEIRCDLGLMRDYFRGFFKSDGFSLFLLTSFLLVVFNRGVIFFVESKLGYEGVASYAVALKFSEAILMVLASVVGFSYPRIRDRFSRFSDVSDSEAHGLFLFVGLLFGVCIFVASIFLMPILIPFVFGSEYAQPSVYYTASVLNFSAVISLLVVYIGFWLNDNSMQITRLARSFSSAVLMILIMSVLYVELSMLSISVTVLFCQVFALFFFMLWHAKGRAIIGASFMLFRDRRFLKVLRELFVMYRSDAHGK